MGGVSCLFLAFFITTVSVVSIGGNFWNREPDWLIESKDRSSQLLTRHPRFLVFSNSGIIKLIFGLVIPVELRKRSLVWVSNLQFQYSTPVNYTQLFPVTYNSKRSSGAVRSVRAIDRTTIYEVIRRMLERQGVDGRACLLRAICQVADTPITHNGLVGEILHVLLTPDTSTSPRSRWRRGASKWMSGEFLSEEFYRAQMEGEAKRRRSEASLRLPRSAAGVEGATFVSDVCRDGFPSCPSSFLDMVSVLLEV